MNTKIAVLLMLPALAIASCSAKPPSPDLRCGSRPAQVLAAQSVPGAEFVPCIEAVVPPWSLRSTDSDQDRTQVVLEWSSSSSANERALVTLKEACPAAGTLAAESPDVPPGVDVTQAVAGRTATTVYSFQGGCVQVDVTRARQQKAAPVTPEDFVIELAPREALNAYVLEQTNGRVELDPEEGS